MQINVSVSRVAFHWRLRTEVVRCPSLLALFQQPIVTIISICHCATMLQPTPDLTLPLDSDVTMELKKLVDFM